jgi:hypothetical protein
MNCSCKTLSFGRKSQVTAFLEWVQIEGRQLNGFFLKEKPTSIALLKLTNIPEML